MTSERDAARLEFETMRKQRLDEFMAGFSTITNKLKEMYQVSYIGGVPWTGGGSEVGWSAVNGSRNVSVVLRSVIT